MNCCTIKLQKLVEKMGGIVVNSLPDVPPETGLIIIGEGGFKNKHLYQGNVFYSFPKVTMCIIHTDILEFV